MSQLLLLFACIVALLALAPQAWTNSRHVVLAGYYRLRVAMRGAGETLDNRRWVTLSVGILIGVVLAGVVPRLVKVDWPEWVPNIPIPNIVVESGPRQILIVRESTPDQNTQLDSTLTQLQNGAASASIQAKGHSVLILDPDAKNANGQPTAALKPWFEKFPSRQSPVLIISDKAGKVLYAEPLSEAAKLADIVAIVEAND
jgi:hypothetical protein